MATVKDIYNYIDSFAPFNTAMEFDNVGLLIGDEEQEVNTAVIALDMTDEVIDTAIEADAQLIITHHPVIFHPIKKIEKNSFQYKLIQNGISVISAHTNLDLAQGFGVNTALADALELKNYYFLDERHPIVMGEHTKSTSSQAFVAFVRAKLNSPLLRASKINKNVKKVAVGGGACGEYVDLACDNGADVFITGEARHHEFLRAKERGLLLIDAGHFETENVVIQPLAEKLSAEFTDIIFTPFTSGEVF